MKKFLIKLLDNFSKTYNIISLKKLLDLYKRSFLIKNLSRILVILLSYLSYKLLNMKKNRRTEKFFYLKHTISNHRL